MVRQSAVTEACLFFLLRQGLVPAVITKHCMPADSQQTSLLPHLALDQL
ncbi:hypothetical protein GMORB2_4053 [Geosmithia morbida]|uniref:NADP-dependent oxidoreductase domain-containing protein n=1 Tax=Geosmithia morbida TaxID=1094350 RepID=A0A9P4Z0K2_9HYPO|nr:uncharacterized protein GMORB2_4053 [Geosmithia morbida]KAF4125214.1 hypothetical protein GMORB2_4053 [Geosmithia morbida]